MSTFDPTLEINRRRMVAILSEMHPGEGLRPACLEGVSIGCASRPLTRTPVMYEPSIYIVASGRKRGYIGERSVTYDPNNYLVLSIPLPFECETDVGENGEPMLGMSIRVDISVISELAVKMAARGQSVPDDPYTCIRATPLDLAMSSAALRLLECLRSSMDAQVLGPGIVREIVYRALCGPQGSTLLAMVGRNGQIAQIHAVLHRIHVRYAEPLNVARLAEDAGMSVSAFHHTFKAVTASSPLQYLKSIRLHKARMLMMHDGMGAAVAATKVGYESASQFSREFKRFFGASPIEESKRIRELLSAPIPEGLRAEPV